MHGRVKVRTTAEQEAVKNAERAKKVKEYRSVMNLLLQKRKDKNWDEEYLCYISKILLKIPDMTTLWNMRREVLETMDQKSDKYIEQLKAELILTEQCLKENPKSYCTWHHRCWCIEHLPEFNWKKELDLCALYLNSDERNFHCWDYRNFLVSKANVSNEEEFEFSTTKINKNFSNYSSWHYRSKILAKMFPDDTNMLPIREDKYTEELDLVMNATFTDPNDSSAWFYQRWLLEPRLPSTATVCRVQLDKHHANISFHKEVEINSSKAAFIVNNVELNCNWKSINHKRFSKFYSTDFAEPLENLTDAKSVVLKFDDNEFELSRVESKELWIYNEAKQMSDGYNKQHLIDQLKNYKMLSEMEPDNKWALLTGIYLMKNIDFVQYYSDVMKSLDILMKKDSLRINYYKDLRSKYVLEHNLIWKAETADQSVCNLSELNLTAIYYEQYLSAFEELDLSNNYLHRSLHLLYSLQNCVKLSLSCNEIDCLNNFPVLKKLEKLSLTNNKISKVEEIVELAKKHTLKEIDLRNNPVCLTDVVQRVAEVSPEVKIIIE